MSPPRGFGASSYFTNKQKAYLAQEFLNKEQSYKKHKRAFLTRTRRPTRNTIPTYFPIVGKKPLHIAQIDLMDVHSLARTNDNVNFLLCMIDVLTKRAWVRPLKDKTMKNIIPASRDTIVMP